MATALELVNRLRRKHQLEAVTALGDDDSTVLLDHLNEAKRDLLEAYTWDFDLRTDGELITMPTLSATVGVSNGLTSANTASFTISSLVFYPAVARMIVTSDATYGETAFKIESAVTSGPLVQMNLVSGWPGTTSASATASIVFDEYVLPSTVRAVTSVRHQERDLQLVETDRDVGMDAWAPRPHANQGSDPWLVFIGKRVAATYNTADSTTELAGISIKFDPTPSTTSLVFSYSYVYRHPDLSASQDLEGVDPPVEDAIVRLAEARTYMSGFGGGDVELGAAMETEVINRVAALKGNSRRDPARRYVIGPSLSSSGNPVYGFGRLPRNFGSL
jgi:hypothetical protein